MNLNKECPYCNYCVYENDCKEEDKITAKKESEENKEKTSSVAYKEPSCFYPAEE